MGWKHGLSTTNWLNLLLSHIFPTQNSCLVIWVLWSASQPPCPHQTHTHMHYTWHTEENHLSAWQASHKHPLSSLATRSLAPLKHITLRRQGDPLHLTSWKERAQENVQGHWVSWAPGLKEMQTFLYCISECFYFQNLLSLWKTVHIFTQFVIIVESFSTRSCKYSPIIPSKQMQRPRGGNQKWVLNVRGEIPELPWTERRIPC